MFFYLHRYCFYIIFSKLGFFLHSLFFQCLFLLFPYSSSLICFVYRLYRRDLRNFDSITLTSFPSLVTSSYYQNSSHILLPFSFQSLIVFIISICHGFFMLILKFPIEVYGLHPWLRMLTITYVSTNFSIVLSTNKKSIIGLCFPSQLWLMKI